MTFAGRDWRANEASVTLCSRDGRIGEGGRLAVNGLEGMQPTRRACMAGGYAFQVYFWLSGRS